MNWHEEAGFTFNCVFTHCSFSVRKFGCLIVSHTHEITYIPPEENCKSHVVSLPPDDSLKLENQLAGLMRLCSADSFLQPVSLKQEPYGVDKILRLFIRPSFCLRDFNKMFVH